VESAESLSARHLAFLRFSHTVRGMETAAQAKTLKISGELTHDPDVCKFHLETDEPVAGGWTLIFNSAADGKGSPLIDALFAVEGLARVMIEESTLVLTKNIPAGWPQMAPEIAKAIRGAFASGVSPLSPRVVEDLKNQPMDGVEELISQLFAEHINPALASHGGYVQLVKVEGHDVYVEMGGGCQGCASAKATMQHGVENAIRRVAPQVRKIIDATDHASGENPYYQ